LWFLAMVAVVAGAGFFFLRGGDGNAPQYLLAKVEQGPVVSKVSSTGTLNPVVTVQVGSQVSGQIKELLADFNTEVTAGQVITRIDPENFEARVIQAEAEIAVAAANVEVQRAALERAKADLENGRAALNSAIAQVEKARVALSDAKKDMDRKRALHQRQIISESEIDKATALYDQCLAQLRSAEAEQSAQASTVRAREAGLKMAEGQIAYAMSQVRLKEAALMSSKIDLAHTVIRSPVDGVVIERNVDMGQTVAASLQAPTLFTIAQDLRKMQVKGSLDEADVGRMHVGQKSVFTVDAFPGEEFVGSVEQVRKAPQTVQNVVTYTAIISADNPDLRLLPGMTANVQIIVEERKNVLKVPNGSLRFRPPGEGGASSGSSTQKKGEGGQGQTDGEERMAKLREALSLTKEQEAQIRTLFSEAREKVAAMKGKGASGEEIQAQIQESRQQAREAMMTLLTPEQRETFSRLSAVRAANPVTPGKVWALDSAGRPSPVNILVGISDGAFSEVVKGDLKPDQMVITGINQVSRKTSGTGKRLGF